MPNSNATLRSPKNQTPRLHLGHLAEAEVFGACSAFPALSISQIKGLVFASPVEKKLWQMSNGLIRENFTKPRRVSLPAAA